MISGKTKVFVKTNTKLWINCFSEYQFLPLHFVCKGFSNKNILLSWFKGWLLSLLLFLSLIPFTCGHNTTLKKSREMFLYANLGCTLLLVGSLIWFFTIGVPSFSPLYKWICVCGEKVGKGWHHSAGVDLQKPECYSLNVHIPQNSYWGVEILTANAMLLGDGTFRRWLVCEGRVFINEISVLIKETLKYFFVSFIILGHSEKMAPWRSGRT